MSKTCVFCGVAGKMTGEHVFGNWLSRIGLSNEPMRLGAGPLNRSLRDLGIARPFTRTVKDVCGSCNNGWMSKLEAVAARVLTPLILGQPGSIESQDFAPLAAWVQKTALISMLLSPEADRARGYGVPTSECHSFYLLREQGVASPDTQFWIGHYGGNQRASAAYVTPMAVRLPELPEPDRPQAYAMTVVLGRLLLQGVRFTTPLSAFELQSERYLVQFWPSDAAVRAPFGEPVDDEALVRVAKGLNLMARGLPVALRAWTPATDLERSTADGIVIRLPTPCGLHVVCYPAVLAEEARDGVFYSFVTSCECGRCYLVKTEFDGAHFKSEMLGPSEEIDRAYEADDGDEIIFEDDRGVFRCKRLASSPRIAVT